jgi:predicted AAA+ superfamily ATPase
MIKRDAEKELRSLAKQFKAVAITGPRQSGKTTLAKYVFGSMPYVNLENPDSRLYAIEDPRGFLKEYSGGAVLDEVQRTPELFSYLQQILDENREKGRFILTGSNNTNTGGKDCISQPSPFCNFGALSRGCRRS